MAGNRASGDRSEAGRRIEDAKRCKATELDLSGLNLASLPASVGHLHRVEDLSLVDNRLASLPACLRRLERLQVLDLRGNRLATLPDWLGDLVALQEISISSNRFVELPEVLADLVGLQVLSARRNRLAVLPDWLGRLAGLQQLNLGDNALSALPDSLGRLAGLELLELRGNRLSAVPDSLGRLAALQLLDLRENRLESLPDSLGRLAGLRRLLLGGNRLSEAPDWLGDLDGLEVLDLRGNGLESLPDSLGRLAGLEALDLHENPALGIPAEILGPDPGEAPGGVDRPPAPGEILRYYAHLRSSRRPLNEVKMILIGRGGVGKTSLVNRLVRGEFDPHAAKTEGIRITSWPLDVDGEAVRLHVWDFGGQEIMHATHQFFLTERTLYLVVVGGREDRQDADAEYWLRLVASFGGESPVIVVANKIASEPCELKRNALRQKYPGIRDFVETDCQEPRNIGRLAGAIRDVLARWDGWRVDFPAVWFAIKDELAGMDEPYLSFDRYREVCRHHREADAQSQDDLAGYLHALGIVLNFRDDPRLRDKHVLNPHWVTGGIYRILNDRALAGRGGVLDEADLPAILPRPEYPREMDAFLIDLMRKFDLCFPFPDDPGRYLVPQLLPRDQPAEAEGFDPAASLCFEYRYPILPEGLLPQFIVRSHALSEGLTRWREGVILGFDRCRALVKADPQDRRVQVLVNGPVRSRRRLLAVIRSDFDRIHGPIFKDGKPAEMVPVSGRPGLVVSYRKLHVLEQNGHTRFTEVVGEDVVELDVSELLDGVDLDRSPRRPTSREAGAGPIRLFYSYAHKDEALRNELEAHLKILERRGLIATWHDRLIRPGDDWAGEIDVNLERADLILLLVSADFLASDYCYATEMNRALARHEAGEAVVIPIVIRAVNWSGAPFGSIQGLPKDMKPVATWADRDEAWNDVSRGIEAAVAARRGFR